MTELIVPRSNSASLPTKCFTVAKTPFGLHAPDVADGEAAGQERVLGVALEVATGQRRAMQVDGRRQQAAAAAIQRLATKDRAELRRNAGFHVAPIAEPHGIAVAAAPPSPGKLSPRVPLGPSVTWTLGIPRRSTATVDKKSAPAVSAAFSSTVSAWSRASTSATGAPSRGAPGPARGSAVRVDGQRPGHADISADNSVDRHRRP